MKTKILLAVFGLMLLSLTGCQALFSNPPPKQEEPIAGMNLVGKWTYWQHWEKIRDLAYEGTMVIEQEACLQTKCEITGYMQFVRAGKTHSLRLSGFSYRGEQLVRFHYQDMEATTVGEGMPVEVYVEFDRFPSSPAPHRAMVGYYVSFSLSSMGPLWDDGHALIAAKRGQIIMVGRVSAWPKE